MRPLLQLWWMQILHMTLQIKRAAGRARIRIPHTVRAAFTPCYGPLSPQQINRCSIRIAAMWLAGKVVLLSLSACPSTVCHKVRGFDNGKWRQCLFTFSSAFVQGRGLRNGKHEDSEEKIRVDAFSEMCSPPCHLSAMISHAFAARWFLSMSDNRPKKQKQV